MIDKGDKLTEVRHLADIMFDRHIDAASLERLEKLITSDLGCLQAYVERIAFHGDLMKQSAERSAERQAERAMGRILDIRSSRQRRQNWTYRIIFATCLILTGICLERLTQLKFPASKRIGTVASMTSDLQKSGGSVTLGQTISAGTRFELKEGILSLQLGQVSVNLIGPVSAQLVSEKSIAITRGAIHAVAGPGGEGFTVKTPGSVVVDLGTEFSVDYQSETGTSVNVLKGRVQASLLDRKGDAIQQLDITANRSAQIDEHNATAREVNFSAAKFEEVVRAKGSIRSIDGALRTLSKPPVSLKAEDQTTTNHMLVIPEQQDTLLDEPVALQGLKGPVLLPAGTRIASYLVHYDPDEWTTFAPRGAVTFDGKIAAVLVDEKGLKQTDALFGLANTEYESATFRELELDEDEIQISDDRKTISFYFGVSGSKPLDQARVLIVRNP